MKFNYEEYKDIGISNIKGTEDMKKLMYFSELGHMIYLFSDSPIRVVSNPCGVWEDISLDVKQLESEVEE